MPQEATDKSRAPEGLQTLGSLNIGALIVTYTWGFLFKFWYIGPQIPIPIMKAPTSACVWVASGLVIESCFRLRQMDSAGIRVGGFKVSSATGCRAWRLEKVPSMT